MTWRLSQPGSKVRLEIADRILCVCRSRTKASLHRDETRRLGCLWSRGLTKRADPIAGAPVASWDVLVSIEKTVGFARSSSNLRRQLLVALPKFRCASRDHARDSKSFSAIFGSFSGSSDRSASWRFNSSVNAGQCAPTPRHRQTPEISAECAEAASRVRMVIASELRPQSPGRCSCCYCKHADGPRQNDSELSAR